MTSSVEDISIFCNGPDSLRRSILRLSLFGVDCLKPKKYIDYIHISMFIQYAKLMVTPWNSPCKWISLSQRVVEFFIVFIELFILFCCYYFYLIFWTHEIKQDDILWPACPKINNGSVRIELDADMCCFCMHPMLKLCLI